MLLGGPLQLRIKYTESSNSRYMYLFSVLCESVIARLFQIFLLAHNSTKNKHLAQTYFDF